MTADYHVKYIYNEMLFKGHPWISNVKEIFDSINATDAFENNVLIVNFKQFSIYVNNTLIHEFYILQIYGVKLLDPIQNLIYTDNINCT